MARKAEQQMQAGAISGKLAPVASQTMSNISFFRNLPYPQTSAWEIGTEVFSRQKCC